MSPRSTSSNQGANSVYRKNVTFLLLAVAALAGCKNEPTDSSAASASAAPQVAPIAVAQLPVKEDYETQARATITANNLDDQLDQLEKQISH
jgi:uncharacterized lipoprotein YajG